jgi:hypothetical protein
VVFAAMMEAERAECWCFLERGGAEGAL